MGGDVIGMRVQSGDGLAYRTHMKFAFTVERGEDVNLIRACSAQEIVVREHRIQRSVILSAGHIGFDWPPSRIGELTAGHMQAAVELDPEVILLGTGAQQHFPDPQVLAPVYRAGIGIEVMDTAAACRTYNVLVQDGRRVAAALILAPPVELHSNRMALG
jgi:uncharacterized protein